MKKKIISLLLALVMVLALLPAGVMGTKAYAEDTTAKTEKAKLDNSIISISTDEAGTKNLTVHVDTNFDLGPISFDELTVGQWQRLEAVACSDGTYALLSVENRKFMGYNTNTSTNVFGFNSPFIKGDADKFKIISLQSDEADQNNYDEHFRDGSTVPCHIFSVKANAWLMVNKTGVSQNKFGTTTQIADADTFYINVKAHEDYSDTELNILHNAGWFNLEGKHFGYWEIQTELGDGRVDALSKLGYTRMHRANTDSGDIISIGNMQCVIGVKQNAATGMYDVIVAFQGTGGYPSTKYNKVDNLIDVGSNLVSILVDNQHTGYHDMAYKLINERFKVVCSVNNKTLNLEDLVVKAATDGTVRFTILGHSMGGAIAQCFGIYLAGRGVPRAEIRGRTFESALALASNGDSETASLCTMSSSGTYDPDNYYKGFTDWYNLCVDSDSVPNGNVQNSILSRAGIHFLGTTVTLYDPKPDSEFGEEVGGICLNKHLMTGALESLLRAHVDDNDSQVYQRGYRVSCSYNKNTHQPCLFAVSSFGAYTYVTKKANANRYGSMGGTVLQTCGINAEYSIMYFAYDKNGNKWYQDTNGGWFKSEDIAIKPVELSVNNLEKTKQDAQVLYIQGLSALVLAEPRADGKVVETLKRADAVTIDTTVLNPDTKVRWSHATTADGKTGWIFSDCLGTQIIDENVGRLSFMCPVDITVYDEGGSNAIFSVKNDGTITDNSNGRISALVIDDEKQLYFYDRAKYQIKITATDYDTFTYVIQTLDFASGTYDKGKTFDYVDLEPGKVMTSTVGGDIAAPDVKLLVLDEKNVPVRTVAENGVETQISNTGTGTGGTGTAAVPGAGSSEWKNPFTDVAKGDWFYDGVAAVCRKGLFSGASATLFEPDGPMTRGMLATVLWSMEGKPVPKTAAKFADVPGSAYYAQAVAWAAENKIASGYSDTRFGPNDSITREQLAAILYSYAQTKGADVSAGAAFDLGAFSDSASADSYALPALRWACAGGLLKGDNGRLMPTGLATRAQVAAVLKSYLKL